MEIIKAKFEGFGIDISDRSIKIAQVKKKGDKLELTSLGEKDIPEGIIVKGKISKNKEEEVIKIIKKAIEEVEGEKIKTKYAVCSLPEENAFIKVIQVPKTGKEEIEEIIKWQIEPNFPVNLEEVYFDWEIASTAEKEKEKKINVSVAVILKEVVDSYLSVFKKAGLQPLSFEIESMAVIRSLIKDSFSPKPVIILDIGKCGTGLTIFSGKTILFTTHIDISGEEMDKAIAKELKIDLKEAEKMKKRVGLSRIKSIHKVSLKDFSSLSKWKVVPVPILERKGEEEEVSFTQLEKQDMVFNALLPILIELAKRTQEYIDYFGEFGKIEGIPDGIISKIILCGGVATMIGLSEFLSFSLKKPVELGNPLSNIDSIKKEIKKKRTKDFLPFTTAIGLALRGIEEK